MVKIWSINARMVLMGVRFRPLSGLDFVVARFDLLVDMRMWITEPPRLWDVPEGNGH